MQSGGTFVNIQETPHIKAFSTHTVCFLLQLHPSQDILLPTNEFGGSENFSLASPKQSCSWYAWYMYKAHWRPLLNPVKAVGRLPPISMDIRSHLTKTWKIEVLYVLNVYSYFQISLPYGVPAIPHLPPDTQNNYSRYTSGTINSLLTCHFQIYTQGAASPSVSLTFDVLLFAFLDRARVSEGQRIGNNVLHPLKLIACKH